MTCLFSSFLPPSRWTSLVAVLLGLLTLPSAALPAATTDALSASNRLNLKVFGQGMEAPNLAFDPVKPGFTLTRQESAVQSCHLSIPLVSKGSEPVRLARTGDSVGVRLGISYRPWVGPYVPHGPRLMFSSTPWAHDLVNGKFSVSADKLGKTTSRGWILGQNDEIANFWLRPSGGTSWPSSTKDGQTAGAWPQGILKLPAWKASAPVELIFSLTRLEGGRLRYYGFCAGVEHEAVVFEETPFSADFLWLDLSNSSAKEIRISTLQIMTP